MPNIQDKKRSWLFRATRGIRFKPDREAVETELREHMEDKTADLLRIFPDMTQEEAMERVIEQMGDPEEIGRELALIHKPWLGYLWQASKVALCGMAAAVLLWSVVTSDHYASRGGNPIWGNVSRMNYVQPAELVPEEVEAGGYTFRVMEAVYRDNPETQLAYADQIEVRLRVSSPRFWERVDPNVMNGLTLVTENGERYPMDRAVVNRDSETGRQYLSIGRQESRWGLFYREFTIFAEVPWQEGDRIGLEFDLGKKSFGLAAEVALEVVE